MRKDIVMLEDHAPRAIVGHGLVGGYDMISAAYIAVLRLFRHRVEDHVQTSKRFLVRLLVLFVLVWCSNPKAAKNARSRDDYIHM